MTTPSRNDLPSMPSGYNVSMEKSVNNNAGGNNINKKMMMMKTPHPSDWQHVKTLMARNFVKDRKKPALWAARFLLGPILFMLYTIGFFIAGSTFSDDGVVNVGDYKLFPGQQWSYPSNLWISGWDISFVDTVGEIVESLLLENETVNVDKINVTMLDMTNLTDFTSTCQEGMPSTALEGVCIFFNASNSYTILYGGNELASPFQAGMAATQYIINQALLDMVLGGISNNTSAYVVDNVQRTPRLLTPSTVNVPLALLLVPSILFVLSVCTVLQFLIGPIVFEKINKVVDAYQMVGVKLRTYLFQWNIYYGLNFLVTAGTLTVISIYWKIFPLSSPFLIFMSHYLAFLQVNSFFVLLMQFQTQEESAQGKPWIFGLFSMAIGAVLLIFLEIDHVLFYIVSAIFPFVGMMQYFGLYTTYDVVGYGTGIHLGDNVLKSGLTGLYIAQLAGIMLFLGLTWLYSSQDFNNWLSNEMGGERGDATLSAHVSEDRFEPLVPGSEVVMSIRGLEHTYTPPRFNCDRTQAPVEVLKGLNLDVCRGEVFGYLGHNGAGKTTSINIVTGQLKMQHGTVTYHLREGEKNLRIAKDEQAIRTNIGVCPQHNTALQNDMTAREFLTLIAHLKGGIEKEPEQTVSQSVAQEVEKRLAEIAFTSEEDADKIIDTYSGGMKRKVLIAMALLGDPDVIFLDEPTAGLDPYNRRTIWDMIIAAKKGRSIILTTHFLDEADVLSDRIGIIKDGVLTTCGSSLFLKHHFGVGYTLSFESEKPIDISSTIENAEQDSSEESGVFRWRLGHGTEGQFSETLEMLVAKGARNVNLDLTTLEQVFLETGKEDCEVSVDAEDDNPRLNDPEHLDPETLYPKQNDISMIWDPRAAKNKVGFWKKLNLVQYFMMANALKSKATILLNITMPLIYLIAGIVLSTVMETPEAGVLIENGPIVLTPALAASQPLKFFGVPNATMFNESNIISPLVPANTPTTIEDYFNGLPVLGGYYVGNATLQYAPELSPFALQIGVGILSNFTAWDDGSANSFGIWTAIQQLPYLSTVPFRVDLLFIPYCLVFGFAGLAFSVLDVLILKGNKVIEIFRVNGLTEWTTYLGVMIYKFNTTFVPFFILLVVLGSSLGIVLFGNGGRWLGTILICMSYAFSSSPQGLILAKRFIRSDFKSVANWFPGVYFTVVGLPYILYSALLQSLPEAEQSILIFGDILSIVPQVAFQRAIGVLIGVSTDSKDPDLLWSTVWAFETRLWYCIVIMTFVGTVEWWYLYRLTTTRESKTKLDENNRSLSIPVSVSHDRLIARERDRSLRDNKGINARDLVKVFKTKDGRRGNDIKFKRAVKGVSFGIRENEIFALLGPNGAGKTVTMSILSSQITPEHGQVALDGVQAEDYDTNSDSLYTRGTVSYCAQADALFEALTVDEHCRFYAKVRGLDWTDEATHEHVDAILKLLSLEKHRHKKAEELSGGYKRRLCLTLSLIGYPNVCMLDEPTTGLDPGARRLVWNVLKPPGSDIQIPAILMSSHYMDECAELGTRIGIMIDGELVSTGSLADLYERYCTSFFIEIAFAPDCDDEKAEQSLLNAFGDISMPATVYESLPYRVKLQVTINDRKGEAGTLQLARIFSFLETKKDVFHIKFYSVAKMNLEQIFINLSRKQFELDEEFENLSFPQESARNFTSIRSL